MSKLASFWRNLSDKQRRPLLFVGFFAIVGAAVLLVTRASGTNFSLEAESTNLQVATKQTDSTASGGWFTQFGSGGSTGGGGELGNSRICSPYSQIKRQPVNGGRRILVTNYDELYAAVGRNRNTGATNSARAGDVIELADGIFERNVEIGNLQGTADAPITIQAVNLGRAIIGAPNNRFSNGGYIASRGTISNEGGNAGGGSEGVALSNMKHVYFQGIDINLFDGQNQATGNAVDIGYDYVADGHVQNLVFTHNSVKNAGRVGFSIRDPNKQTFPNSLDLQYINVRCNFVTRSGRLNPILQQGGEAMYMGKGQTGDNAVHDVTIEYNEITEVNGDESIDVKVPSYNITIRGNLIHDTTTRAAGAVVLGCGAFAYRNGNYLVEKNLFWNLRNGRTDGHNEAIAISVAHGKTVIRNNIVWATESNAITLWDSPPGGGYCGFGTNNFNGDTSVNDVFIYNNTFWNCGTKPSCLMDYTADSSYYIRTDLSNRNNLYPGASGDNRSINGTEFVGPTANSADAGQGAGSGFRLKADSPLLNSAPALDFTDDVYGTTRTSPWSFGAFE